MAAHLKPLVSSWRPDDTTVIAVVESRGAAMPYTLVAVPAAGGRATPLISVAVSAPGDIDLRRDGSALVASIPLAYSPTITSRLAVWDLRTGALRWITPEDDGVDTRRPRWSADGAFVYYSRVRWPASGAAAQPPDLGVFRVRADGSDARRIHDPAPTGKVGAPEAVTDDGVLLWWLMSAGSEGATLEAFDLTSGRGRSSGQCARFMSWRSARPRALLETAVCAVGPDLRSVALWDDVAGALTVLTPKEDTRGADWDLSGTRVVVALRSGSGPYGLATMDTAGGARTRLAGTDNARDPRWLRAGIAYLWSNAEHHAAAAGDAGDFWSFTAPYEVRLTPPAGGSATTLYRTDDTIVEIRFVRP